MNTQKWTDIQDKMKSKKYISIFAAVFVLLILIFSYFMSKQNEIKIFPVTDISVKKQNLTVNGDDGWAISGKTSAPDGTNVIVFDPKSSDKENPSNYNYGPVKNGRFRVGVSGSTFSDDHKVLAGEKIKVIVAPISNLEKNNDELIDIPDIAVKKLNAHNPNVMLNVNKSIQSNAKSDADKADADWKQAESEVKQDKISTKEKVNASLASQIKNTQEKAETDDNYAWINYIDSMKYLKSDGNIGVRVNLTNADSLSSDERYDLARKAQQLARKAINSLQDDAISKQFNLNKDNGFLPFVEVGSGEKGLSNISDPNTHMIIH